MKRVGAKVPPGVPLKNEKPVASIFKPASSKSSCQVNWPCMAWSTIAYPAPITCGKRMPIRPITGRPSRLEILRPTGKRLNLGTGIDDPFEEQQGDAAAGNTENGVCDPLPRDWPRENGGTRKSDSGPRIARMVTTLDTAANTIAPSAPALQVPITSSTTKSTAEIGALKAAAKPAAAPRARSSATFRWTNEGCGRSMKRCRRPSAAKGLRDPSLSAADRDRGRHKLSDDRHQTARSHSKCKLLLLV